MRKLLVAIFLISGTISYAQFGLFASAAYMDINGSKVFYNNTAPGMGQDIGSVTYQGTDFGIFSQNSGNFKLYGSEVKTFKGATDNVCGANLHYTVYPLGMRPASPIYSNIMLGFYSDCFSPSCGSFFGSFDVSTGGGCCSGGDQKWQSPGFGSAANIDLTTYPIGDYTLEIYYSFTGEDAGPACSGTKYDNNNNAPVNYTASFSISAPSPVSFGEVRVVNNQSINTLFWNTYSESNSKNFTIERSSDGINFYGLGEIAAAGFSTVLKEYRFTDKSPVSGMNYYRIRMNEFDGKFQYSRIVSIKNNSTRTWILANNPTSGNIRLLNTRKGDLVILFNSNAAEISRQVSTDKEMIISTQGLSSGTYFLKVSNAGSQAVIPVIINRP